MHLNALLVDSAAKAAIILAAAFLITIILRESTASARYLTWICAFSAILLLPVLSAVMPAWEWNARVPAAAPAAEPVPTGKEALSTEITAATKGRQGEPWLGWMGIVWLAGALGALIRLGSGHLRLEHALRRTDVISTPDWRELLTAVAKRMGVRQVVVLRRSHETDVPMTCGIFSSKIVLPAESDDWGAEQRRLVLLHELTHIRRRDPLISLGVRVAGALYWFHPFVWLAMSRFRGEQERSCDDAVIRAGAGPSAYAATLVDLARSVTPNRAYPSAVHMAATSDLEQRVRALLSSRHRRNGVSRRMCLAASAAVVAALLPLAAVHAQTSGPRASLSGSVLDPSGAAVPGALILLKSTAHQEAARSNDAGEYTFLRIPADAYSLQVTAPGFAKFQKRIALNPGAASTINITVDMGATTEALDVIGKAPRPATTVVPKRVRVGGNVQATKLISVVKPVYPPNALAAGIEGTVLLRAVISIDGSLLGTTVLNSSVDPGLAAAALDAVKQWRYQPTLLNGVPVEVVTTIALSFRVD